MNNLSYKGKSFNQRESDGYVNLGQLCATHGKKQNDWGRLKSSNVYLEALSEETGIPVTDLIIVQHGNATWGHPLVAIEVARWINPKFGVWCNQHIKTLIETGSTAIAQPGQPQLPQTYLEALKALVAAEEQRELLEAEKALLEETNHALAEAVDELFDYSSIIRIAKFNGISEKSFKWHRLKAASNKLGLEIKKVPCPRFGEKNLYSHDAWRLAYPGVSLPETTTLVVHAA